MHIPLLLLKEMMKMKNHKSATIKTKKKISLSKQKKKIKLAKSLVLSRQSKNVFDLNQNQIDNAFKNHVILISSKDTDEAKDWICKYPNSICFFIKNKKTCNHIALFISYVNISDVGYARRVYVRELKSPIYLPDKAKDKFNTSLPVSDIEQMRDLIK